MRGLDAFGSPGLGFDSALMRIEIEHYYSTDNSLKGFSAYEVQQNNTDNQRQSCSMINFLLNRFWIYLQIKKLDTLITNKNGKIQDKDVINEQN